MTIRTYVFKERLPKWLSGRYFWRWILGLIPESVISKTKVAIDSSLIQPCSMCLGASRGDGLCQLVVPEQY